MVTVEIICLNASYILMHNHKSLITSIPSVNKPKLLDTHPNSSKAYSMLKCFPCLVYGLLRLESYKARAIAILELEFIWQHFKDLENTARLWQVSYIMTIDLRYTVHWLFHSKSRQMEMLQIQSGMLSVAVGHSLKEISLLLGSLTSHSRSEI